ncbi:hypothetical protein Bpla01_20470 [Burkholderia plantarii]|nr:hypothetical protein Bpla01_20470 [Burkholderia plantarii]
MVSTPVVPLLDDELVVPLVPVVCGTLPPPLVPACVVISLPPQAASADRVAAAATVSVSRHARNAGEDDGDEID